MSLTIFGANSFSRKLAKSLGKNYASVRLADTNPFRRAVYDLQESNTDLKIEKVSIHDKRDIGNAVRGSKDVIFVTHDYFLHAPCKNSVLKKTSDVIAVETPERFIAVTPIEFDHYGEADVAGAKAKTAEHVFNKVPSATIINPNLLFGEGSYFVHYLIQCALKSKSGPGGDTTFAPVGTDDVAALIEKALKGDSTKGKFYNLDAANGVKYSQIVDAVSSYAGKNLGKDSLLSTLLNIPLIAEELYGNHAINMTKMLSQDFSPKTGGDSITKDLSYELKDTILQYYSKAEFQADNFSSPKFEEYRDVHLN